MHRRIKPELIDKNPLVPQDIVREDGEHAVYETIYGIEAGSSFMNKFEYEEKFTKLEGSTGVRFNVETLPEPKDKHKNKKPRNRKALLRSCEHIAANYYSKEYKAKYHYGDMRLEAVYQEKNEGNLVYTGADAFLVCCITAFAQHLPLALAPDHIWSLITFAFQKHVNKHSEELREKFVKHQGKERIMILTPNADSFPISKINDPDSGATAQQWEQHVFSQFSKQIAQHTGEKLREVVAGTFSTSTPATKACGEVSLMTATKDFFSFGMKTAGCGIPEVTLLGTEEDWISLRERAELLGEYMTEEFSKKWLPHLLPVLDNFVQSAKGNVHHGFWQSMVKFRAVRGGSGMSVGGISGWVQLFYPYLEKGMENQYLRPWNEMYYTGHNSRNFPSIINSVPVDWTYVKTLYNITFHAGFTGYSQDEEGRLMPNIGWYVTHAPDPPPHMKLKLVQDEIEALLKNQAGKNEEMNKESPLYKRLKQLLKEEELVLRKVTKRDIRSASVKRIEARKKKYGY